MFIVVTPRRHNRTAGRLIMNERLDYFCCYALRTRPLPEQELPVLRRIRRLSQVPTLRPCRSNSSCFHPPLSVCVRAKGENTTEVSPQLIVQDSRKDVKLPVGWMPAQSPLGRSKQKGPAVTRRGLHISEILVYNRFVNWRSCPAIERSPAHPKCRGPLFLSVKLLRKS